jgi:hypothetical protein
VSLAGDEEKIDYFINNRQKGLDAFQKRSKIFKLNFKLGNSKSKHWQYIPPFLFKKSFVSLN